MGLTPLTIRQWGGDTPPFFSRPGAGILPVTTAATKEEGQCNSKGKSSSTLSPILAVQEPASCGKLQLQRKKKANLQQQRQKQHHTPFFSNPPATCSEGCYN
jgi:hypothetical protein